SGRFDGRVYEYAQWSPRTGLPAQPAALRERIAAEANALLQLGITSIQNMAIGTPLPELIAAWQEAGTPLRLRAVRTPLARAPGEAPDHPDLPVDDPDRPRITVAGTKWILDGTPMERGAAMRQPYPDGSRGHQNFSPAQVRALLQDCSHAATSRCCTWPATPPWPPCSMPWSRLPRPMPGAACARGSNTAKAWRPTWFPARRPWASCWYRTPRIS